MTTNKTQADRIAAYVALQKREAMFYVLAALRAGYTVSVYDGEEWTLKSCGDAKEIRDALFTSDEDQIVIRDADGNRVGWMYFVYGNEPGVLVCDYSDNEKTRAIYEACEPRRERMEMYKDPR